MDVQFSIHSSQFTNDADKCQHHVCTVHFALNAPVCECSETAQLEFIGIKNETKHIEDRKAFRYE